MSYTKVMVFCLVLGDAVRNAFVVDIKEDQTISHLKELIKEKKKNGFRNIDANDIMLWKVDDIPISKENLKTKIRDDINIEQELGGMVLLPSDIINQHFYGLTRKRKTECLDEENEGSDRKKEKLTDLSPKSIAEFLEKQEGIKDDFAKPYKLCINKFKFERK
ncbi:12099_t:CDS:2, partial [Cetraspora pellucida]